MSLTDYLTIVTKIRQEWGMIFPFLGRIFWGDGMGNWYLENDTYIGEISDENIRGIFGDTGDLNRRLLKVGANIIFIYSIDGLVSGGDISEFVIKTLMHP